MIDPIMITEEIQICSEGMVIESVFKTTIRAMNVTINEVLSGLYNLEIDLLNFSNLDSFRKI